MNPLLWWLTKTKTTQVQLAERCGLQQSAISKYKRSLWKPGRKNANRIAQATLEIEKEKGFNLGGVPVARWDEEKPRCAHGRKAA